MRFVDLFCGCGGASLGLLRSGLRHSDAFDVDADALASYRIVTGRRASYADLSEAALSDLLRKSRPGLIWMSPPCQPFSGMQNIEKDHRTDLFDNVFAQAVVDFPKSWLVLENVPRALRSDVFKSDLIIKHRGVIMDDVRLKRYVVDCADYGVPQSRKRLFLIIPPKGVPLLGLPPHSYGRRKTFKDAIYDLDDHDPACTPLTTKERSILESKRPQGWVPDNKWSDTPLTVLAARRVWLPSGRFTHPKELRRLTVGECMAIQGLPPVRLHGPVDSRYRQTGNAVPPAMAEMIGRLVQGH